MSILTKPLPLLHFSYDGAPDSKNSCPNCGDSMFWYDLQPFGKARWMTCDDCEIFCDTHTEEVFVADVSERFQALMAMYGGVYYTSREDA